MGGGPGGGFNQDHNMMRQNSQGMYGGGGMGMNQQNDNGYQQNNMGNQTVGDFQVYIGNLE